MEIKDSQTTNFLPEMKVATEMKKKKVKDSNCYSVELLRTYLKVSLHFIFLVYSRVDQTFFTGMCWQQIAFHETDTVCNVLSAVFCCCLLFLLTIFPPHLCLLHLKQRVYMSDVHYIDDVPVTTDLFFCLHLQELY